MLPQIRLERHSSETLHDQLAGALRRLIETGVLAPGARLPPTRRAAESLGVSRTVVVVAYEQLQLEGYLTAKLGAGTWVPESLPAHLLPPERKEEREGWEGKEGKHPGREAERLARLSSRGRRMAGAAPDGLLQGGRPGLFRPGAVAAELFPARTWARLSGRVWRRDGPSLVPYGDPLGFGPLREQLADYLARYRAVRCDADQIVITTGSQHALNLLVQLLLDPGEKVVVEDPGYLGFRAALRSGGLDPAAVPVDEDGIDVARLEAEGPAVRMLYATPSHQYPLGVTLPLERRLRLLEWARSEDAWIVEDDYDSEFRYRSRPLPALQGLDPEGRVIYLGTFSKVLAPSLRVGFAVLPSGLVEPFRSTMAAQVYHPSTSLQATLSEFIEEGHMERHINRLRGHYGDRWSALKQALDDRLRSCLDVLPGAAGLHLSVVLDPAIDDREVARIAGEQGLETPPLSRFYLGPAKRSGLLLGFGGTPPQELREGVEILARVLERVTA